MGRQGATAKVPTANSKTPGPVKEIGIMRTANNAKGQAIKSVVG